VRRISFIVGVTSVFEVERDARNRILPVPALTPLRSAGGATDVQVPPEFREYS